MTRTKEINNEWKERTRNCMAQETTGVNSKRWTQYVDGPTPTHSSAEGIGPYSFDAWGNRYLDFPSALGALSLGYSNQRVVEATQRQCAKGASFTLPTKQEVELSEMLCGLIPSVNRVRYLQSGNEAALAAIRIARAATGRKYVLSDGYHGHGDLFTSLTPPALGVADEFKILPLSEPQEFLPQCAAVIVEALKLEMSTNWMAYLKDLRENCRKRGVVFIVDEIVTGFRVPKWTVSNMWDLDPDIILLGKGMANGFPLSAVLGKREVMDAQEYFISSTFSGNAVSLAACRATLEELQQRSFEDLIFYGQRLQSRLNQLHPEIKFEGWGTRAMLNTTNPVTALFMQEMVKAGFLFGKAHFFHFGHLEANIEDITMSVAASVTDRIKRGEVKLEGKIPTESFKR